MARRKKKTGALEEARTSAATLTVTAFGLGVGAQIVGRAGGPTGGLQTFGKFQPVIGTAVGAKTTAQLLDETESKNKKRSKRLRGIL